MPLTCHKTQIKPKAIHGKKVGYIEHQIWTIAIIDIKVSIEQLQVGVGYSFLNALNDVKLTTLGGKLFQATTTRSLKVSTHIKIIVS